MRVWFLFLVLIAFLPFVWGAKCTDPDINIFVPDTLFAEGGTIDVNLVLSGDPSPITSCGGGSCSVGNPCGLSWQFLFDGQWIELPTVPNSSLSCGSGDCNSGIGWPEEDLHYQESVLCNGMGSYRLRGYHALTGNQSEWITVYCYKSEACVPPVTGNFDLNAACLFDTVPVRVDGNYNILSNGSAFHQQSNITFDGNGSQFVNIHDGGRLDLNKSRFVAGLNNPIVGLGGMLGLFLVGIGLVWVRFSRREVWA